MAFFGLTHLGYQNPIGDKMVVNPRGSSSAEGTSIQSRGLSSAFQEHQGHLRGTDICSVYQQPLPYSTEIHQGSHERYKEMIKRVQTPRSPDQLYVTPLTDNQKYGWLTSKSPEPWSQVQRFPHKNSEMTKFVEEMVKTDQDFSLF
ncbi:testis-expressed protein 49 [Sphaeramia orbicularis]|uniref:testis-expressed protein 49 n=1 Tax=Sphaeramia orbicularis TaxID=375764 RepID=UPI00117CFC49|nr:testis-expressed protein 49 [Sphaeramia orbicularis]